MSMIGDGIESRVEERLKGSLPHFFQPDGVWYHAKMQGPSI
jgi:hypothetical protein